MKFQPIDWETFPRKEHFLHYTREIPCSYSMTSDVEISRLRRLLRERGYSLYPTLIYALSCIANDHPEFRTVYDQNRVPGVYDVVDPAYTIFHPETETFSCIVTPFEREFSAFYRNCRADMECYRDCRAFLPQPAQPNLLNISCIPWTEFRGFHLQIRDGYDFLLPIVTVGKYREENGKLLLPVALQVHHAVCDGFHVGRFFSELQAFADGFEPPVGGSENHKRSD